MDSLHFYHHFVFVCAFDVSYLLEFRAIDHGLEVCVLEDKHRLASPRLCVIRDPERMSAPLDLVGLLIASGSRARSPPSRVCPGWQEAEGRGHQALAGCSGLGTHVCCQRPEEAQGLSS